MRECSLHNLRSGHSHDDVDQLFGTLAIWLLKHGREAEDPKDILKIVQAFLDQLDRPFERLRKAYILDQARDWLLGIPFCQVKFRSCSLFLDFMWLHPRKGFLSEGVPVMLKGLAGPGAPHVFEMSRRESMSLILTC